MRVALLGKKGSLTGVLRGLGALSPEERPAAGKVSNEVRVALEAALAEREAASGSAAALARAWPPRRSTSRSRAGAALRAGSTSSSASSREISDIFIGLGYRIAEGPEVELDYYNFTALNTPPDHPARNASDTFYVEDLSGETPRS